MIKNSWTKCSEDCFGPIGSNFERIQLRLNLHTLKYTESFLLKYPTSDIDWVIIQFTFKCLILGVVWWINECNKYIYWHINVTGHYSLLIWAFWRDLFSSMSKSKNSVIIWQICQNLTNLVLSDKFVKIFRNTYNQESSKNMQISQIFK